MRDHTYQLLYSIFISKPVLHTRNTYYFIGQLKINLEGGKHLENKKQKKKRLENNSIFIHI